MLYALIAFVVVDYITGVMCAVVDKKLSSEVGFKGIFKKILIFLLVGIANLLDVNIIGNGSVLRTAAIFFYLSNEGVSLLENATHLGLPVPEKLKNVLQQLHDITKRFSDEGRIPREYVQQVNNVIGDSLRSDDEWNRFKLHFDSVHPDFFVNLKAHCADLTENDLRLCAYIRIGMRAKQIAEMLSVTPDSVNTARYRLRKKMGLDKGQSLDDFIRQV